MKETNVVIQEEFKLPSLGKVYDVQFDPTVKLRSMTVAEEMKRTQASNTPYKVMSDIIEDCLLTELPIHVYDMCLGDYQYLLHKLRVVTYGSEYKLLETCPYCGNQHVCSLNLDDLKVFEYTSDFDKFLTVNLPRTGHTVKLRLQTPRDLDKIQQKTNEMMKNYPDMKGDIYSIITLESFIDTIDGEPLNYATGLETLKALPMQDGNILTQKAAELNRKVGIDTSFTSHCDRCDRDVTGSFRFTSEFFRPSVD